VDFSGIFDQLSVVGEGGAFVIRHDER
jgi:hypothetical protein